MDKWFGIILTLFGAWTVCDGASKACPFKPADLIFVVDASGSEGSANFQKQLTFIKNFTSQFEIGPNATQVSLVTFATTIRNEFYLNAYHTKPDVLAAISKTHYLNGETYTHLALRQVYSQNILPSHGARQNVSKIVIVLTDGRSNEDKMTLAEANILKQKHDVTVMAIGIGSNVDPAELRAIASDGNHTFQVSSFDALSTIQSDLTDEACNVCDESAAEIYFLLDSSGSEGSRNFMSQLQFVNLIANEYSIGQHATRIGVATYSTNSQQEIALRDYDDKTALMQNVLKIPYRDGESNMHLGLNVAYNELSHHSRRRAETFLIALTDGRSTEPALTHIAAHNLHRAGIEVFVVGVGHNTDGHEMTDVATDKSHVFGVHRFTDLDSIHQSIADKICAKRTVTTTMAPTTVPTTTVVTTTTKPVCGAKPADIVFLLDSSDSEGKENFQKQLDFVRDFATQFAIGPNNNQFSVVTFSSDVVPQFYFNNYSRRNQVLQAISNITYIGTGTNTSEALKFARTESFKPEHGARQNASKIVIVITDGHSSDPTRTTQEAKLLHSTATVFSIGIGPDVDGTELRTIASNRHDVVQVDSFALLHTIKKQLTDTACS